MRGFRQYPSFIGQGFLVWMALFAFVLHGLVPVGYMPDAGSNKTSSFFNITICTGHGKAVVEVDQNLKPTHGDRSKNSQDSTAKNFCPFSIGNVYSPVPPSYLLLILVSLIGLITAPIDFRLARLRDFGSVSARAPPLFS